MKKKPKIVKAFLSSLLGFIVYFVVYIVIFLIAAAFFLLVSRIPLLSTLVGWLFRIRGDTPDILSVIISSAFAYTVAAVVLEKINQDTPTEGLSCILLGSYITALHAASLVINIVYSNPFFINIVQIIAGIAMIIHGKNETDMESEFDKSEI